MNLCVTTHIDLAGNEWHSAVELQAVLQKKPRLALAENSRCMNNMNQAVYEQLPSPAFADKKLASGARRNAYS